MTRWVLVLVICLPTTFVCQTQAQQDDKARGELEENHSLASDLVTPHKAWGRGYARGEVRALFFIYSGPYGGTWDDPGTRLRDVVELCQRFDLRGDAVLFGGSGDPRKWAFHGGKLGEERAERLLAKPYQLYVVGGFPMERLPAKIQYLILEQVAGGAGLVCCGPAPCEYMTTKRRIDPLPAPLVDGVPVLDGKPPTEYTTAYRMRDGRGVWLKYEAHAVTARHSFSWRGLAEYDYWALVAGRALLWAASREAEVSVNPATAEGSSSVDRAQAGRATVTLTNTSPRPLQVIVTTEVRRASDGWRKSLGEARAAVVPGQPVQVSVSLPRLRADDYFLDVVVKSSRGVEGFGARAFTVTSDFGVESVVMDRSFVERGETMTGKITLRGTPPVGSTVRLRLRDSYDRVLSQQDFPITADKIEYPFEYRADGFSTILMRAEAVLVSAGEEVEMKDASFTVPKRRHGQMNFVMWDAPNDVLGYYAWRKLQEAGMNIALIGSQGKDVQQPPALRACDASLVPYSTRILDEKDEKGYMKPVCWNDEPAVTQYVQGIVDNQKNLREQGVFVYSLGDEGVTLGCCVHPSCITAYRRYLAAQYGTIEKLNTSWGTEYKSFDEVNLLDPKDNMETAALKTSYPRWYDRQAFARYNLMQFSGRFVEAYRRLDPESLTAFEGTGGFGDDYDAILSINTFYGPYPGLGDDIIRSAAPRDFVRSNWMGYSKTADALSDAAWRMVMKGMDSIWFWMWDGIGAFRGYLRPTLDFWPATAELAEEMAPVRQGLGDLLLQSNMAHSGVAIFYSLPSALSSRLENGPSFVSTEATHRLWVQLTYDLGLDFRYLTSAMIKRGALDPGEFKVLLLPMTQAIGPEEAEAIRRFAERGGTVIADVRPGIYDDHCKPVTPGVLDDLFGIQRTGRGEAADLPVSLEGDLWGRKLKVEFATARVDKQVKVGAAQALAQAGETPVLLVNTVGTGRAVLLNFQLLVPAFDDPQAPAARQLLRDLYEAAGARALIASQAPGGGPLPMTETRVWQNGDALVIGLWRQMQCAWFAPKSGDVAGPPVPVRVDLGSPRHVYDLRAHKYLGRVARIDTKLRWGRANFYMALPYEVRELAVGLSSRSPRPGDTLTASIRLRVPRDSEAVHAVWVQVIDPQGQQPFWGQKVVLLRRGVGEVKFPVAYNDLPGEWRVKATELFSGVWDEATWTVR